MTTCRSRDWSVIETDLGEYINQIAGEGPSHIIVPAIHKNRRQIGELFAEKLGCDLHGRSHAI